MSFMLRRERRGAGGVVADEPGLGKTLTCLCVMLRTAQLRGGAHLSGAGRRRAPQTSRAHARPALVVLKTL